MATLRTENLVVTSALGDSLDLKAIARRLEGTEYDPHRFPGLLYRLKEPRTTTLLFKSGKALCTGAKSVDDARTAIALVAKRLRAAGFPVHRDREVEVQNIVATADLGARIDLNAVARSLAQKRIEYEPEQFPGLVYRLDEPKAVVLLFGTGRVVCTGVRTLEDVERAIKRVATELRADGLLV